MKQLGPHEGLLYTSFARYSWICCRDHELMTNVSQQIDHHFAHRVDKTKNSSCQPALGPTHPVYVRKSLLHTFV